MRTKVLSINHIEFDTRFRIFWGLVGLTFLLIFVYIYGINTTARNIAVRQNLEKKASIISGNLDSLEYRHIELKNNITVDLAHEYGFKEALNPLYVSRSTENSLSFNALSR